MRCLLSRRQSYPKARILTELVPNRRHTPRNRLQRGGSVMRTLPGTGSLVILLLASMARPAAPQSHPVFEGMWGDPPVSAEDTFCAAYCTDAGLQRLGALLDDPKNDNRPYVQLSAEADNYQRDSYIRPLLTP